jgi:hypothetical protein
MRFMAALRLGDQASRNWSRQMNAPFTIARLQIGKACSSRFALQRRWIPRLGARTFLQLFAKEVP